MINPSVGLLISKFATAAAFGFVAWLVVRSYWL